MDNVAGSVRFARLAGGGLLVAAGWLSAHGAAAAPGSIKEIHKTLPLSATGRLAISTYKGTIDVSVWDRPEADVAARVEPDGDDPEGAQKVEQTEIRIDGGGGDVRVKSDYHRVSNHHLFSFLHDNGPLPLVHYTIRMPATARLEIDDYKSRSKIAGLKSDLKLHTYKGTVEIDAHDGAVELDTYKGDVRTAFARFSRASRFETYKGTVEVRLPKDSRFELDAHGGRRGEVDTDFAVTSHRSRRFWGESAEGAVNGGGPLLRFESRRGTFRLRGV